MFMTSRMRIQIMYNQLYYRTTLKQMIVKVLLKKIKKDAVIKMSNVKSIFLLS